MENKNQQHARPPAAPGGAVLPAPGQAVMTLEEFLEKGNGKWFRASKKPYPVQAMMVSRETSFRNELEVTDYTVTDDGVTVVLTGIGGEMWTSSLDNVLSSYTLPDGSRLSKEDFAEKDIPISLTAVPAPGSYFAMHVPDTVSVTVVTDGGNVLHSNLPNAPHGNGDFLVCRAGEDGKPDLSGVWILNGLRFPEAYAPAAGVPD